MSVTPPSSRNANVALWVMQALLAALFLFAGIMKFIMPVADMTKGTSFSGGFMHFIGTCEILGALGLILPWLTGRHRQLTPLAALGLLIIMIGAVVVTARGPQPSQAIMPAIVGVLCAFVAWGRRAAARPITSAATPIASG